MLTTTVTQKGQVTIPVAIRNLLGIKPNQKVSFSVNRNNEVRIKSVITTDEAFGMFKDKIQNKFVSKEEMKKAIAEGVISKFEKKK
jgi:AbrB family looped-hinge helix DNA binding protein